MRFINNQQTLIQQLKIELLIDWITGWAAIRFYQ